MYIQLKGGSRECKRLEKCYSQISIEFENALTFAVMGRRSVVSGCLAYEKAIWGHGWGTSVDVRDARHAFVVVFKGLLAPLFKQPFGLLRHWGSLRHTPVRAIPRRRTRSITGVGTQRLPVRRSRRRSCCWRGRPWRQLLLVKRHRGHQYLVVARGSRQGPDGRSWGGLEWSLLAMTTLPLVVGRRYVIQHLHWGRLGLLRPLGLLWFAETAEQHV